MGGGGEALESSEMGGGVYQNEKVDFEIGGRLNPSANNEQKEQSYPNASYASATKYGRKVIVFGVGLGV